MRNLRGTYVHRGDAARRRKRIKNSVLAVGFVLAVVLITRNREPQEARAETTSSGFSFGFSGETSRLRDSVNALQGRLDLTRTQLERANKVIAFSTRYRIGADLAGAIMDVALAEGIEPELAFRLVKLESDFNEHARSSVGAVGLTQVMPATAQYFQRGITRDALYDRRTNLRIGFRYLRTLIDQYKGNVRIALLVYNRGPLAVNNALEMGLDPANGYDRIIMKGYRGKGTVD